MTRLLLDERIRADGQRACTWATVEDDHLAIVDDDGTHGKLSVGAVDRVMSRYGRPLDAEIRLAGEVLELSGGVRLRRLHHHAPVDAMGRDYLVWERPGEEPLAVLATHATAAIRYLVLRLGSQETEG